MFDRGQEGLRSNHLYKKQMCRGELVLIQARQIGFTWIKSSQTQDKLKKNRKIQTLPSSLLPFIKIYDGPSRYVFSVSRYHLKHRSVYAAASILGGVDSTRCLEDSTREILAHIDTASSLAADLKLRIHDANLPVQVIERWSIEVRPHNWGGIHCCVQHLRRVELCEMTRCPARSQEQGELLQLESGFLLKHNAASNS